MSRVTRVEDFTDHAPIPVIGVSRDGTLIHANDAALRLVGRDRNEALGKPFWEFLSSGADRTLRRRFQKLIDRGLPSSFESRVATPDGDAYMRWFNTIVFDEDGAIAEVYAAGIDITAERTVQRQLRSINALLRALNAISGVAIRETDPGRLLQHACESLVYAGAAEAAWIVVAGDEPRPIGIYHCASDASQECFVTALNEDEPPLCMRQALAQPGFVVSHSLAEICDDCAFRTLEAKSATLTTAIAHRGETFGVLTVHVPARLEVGEEHRQMFASLAADLAFRLAALEAQALHDRTAAKLERQTRILDAFFEHTLAPSAVLDREFNFIRVNRAYAEADGREPEYFVGRNHFELYPHEDNQRIFERVRDTGEAFEVRARPFVYPDNPERGVTYWDWTLVPIAGDDGETELLAFSLRDVTEEERAKQRLEQQRDHLDELVQERTEALREEIAEREAAQQALHATNELLESIIAASPVAIALHDLEANIQLWNPAAERITGWSAAEVVGGPSPLVAPKKAGQADELMQRLREGEQLDGVEIVRQHRKGHDMHLRLSATPLGDSHGAITGYLGLFSDITEEKRAEEERQRLLEELSTERATLAAIIEQAPEGIVVADEQCRITMVNPAAEELYRRPVPIGEDLQSHSRLHLCYPDGSRCPVQELPLTRSCLNGELVLNEELLIVWPDGQRRDLLISTAPIRTEAGEPAGAIGIIQDVTDRREAERERQRLLARLEVYAEKLEERVRRRTAALSRSRAELRQQRDFIDAVVQRAGSLVVVVDPSGAILRFNRACEELTGYSEAELAGREFIATLIAPEERERVEKDFASMAEGEITDYEAWWSTRDGERRLISWRISSVFDDDGAVEFIIGTGWDITEQRRMETALRESEQKYRELVESARSIIIHYDVHGTIRFVNEYGLELLGYSEEQLVGETIHVLIPETDSYGNDLSMLPEEVLDDPDEYWTTENENITSYGERLWISWANRVIRDDEGQVAGIMAVGVDRTEQKKAEERLRRSREDLRELTSRLAMAEQHERREIATALHDNLGQLLAFAKMQLSHSLQSGEDVSVEALEQVLSFIEEAIGFTRSLTTQLSPPVLHQLGLDAALEWLADDLNERHRPQIEFRCEVEVSGLSEQLRLTLFQGARELLSNCIKHANAEQVILRLGLKDETVFVEVRDDGIGFCVGDLERGEREGGFGLFNIRERLEYIGGRLELQSSPGEGTTARIEAPVGAFREEPTP